MRILNISKVNSQQNNGFKKSNQTNFKNIQKDSVSFGNSVKVIPFLQSLNLRLQRLLPEDISSCIKHIVENATANGIEYPKERIKVFEDILGKITRDPQAGVTLVAKTPENKIVSSCIVDYFQDYQNPLVKNGEVMGVYTSPNFQHKGLTSYLLKRLIALSIKNNCENLFLYVRTPAAKHLYEKFGFKPIVPPEYNGRVLMQLPLRK